MHTISRDTPALYLTDVAKDRLPVFRTDAIKLITCAALNEARKSGSFSIYAYVLMPDHLHALLSFPPSGKTLKLIISKWKEWTAKELGIVWQRDFFEHRLRHDESRREKADYILQNPVRKKLVARPEDWPFVYFGDGERPQFER